jgi:hypothetical protein
MILISRTACFTVWWAEELHAIPSALRKGISSMILLTACWIWKHRNAAIFDNTQAFGRFPG